MIGDVVIDCDWAGEQLAGFENHGGRTLLDAQATPLGRVVSGFGNDGSSGFEGAREGRIYGTYLHGPLLPRNPWFADRLLAEALEHAGGAPVELAPLPDLLESEARRVAVARALSRGGRF
jgi:CobQ-like glutamine amidotransferase family enzyme